LKKSLFTVLSLLLGYAFLEVLCASIMMVIEKNPYPRLTLPVKFHLSAAQKAGIVQLMADTHGLYSSELGWRPRPTPNNPDGIRNAVSVGIESRKKRRIATFGDSFTWGDEVGDTETWEHQLENDLPNSEVLNFGMSMYGTDQAFLRYRLQGAKYHPDIVLIGLQPENTCRNVNVFRPFYIHGDIPPMAKPRFVFESGALRLLPNPFAKVQDYQALLDKEQTTLQMLGRNDYYYDCYKWNNRWEKTPFLRLLAHLSYTIRGKRIKQAIVTRKQFDPSSDAFQLTIKITDSFYREVRANKGRPVILLIPTISQVELFLKTRNCHYQGFRDEFKNRGFSTIDLMDVLVSAAGTNPTWKKDFFREGGHYSPRANKLIADFIASKLTA